MRTSRVRKGALIIPWLLSPYIVSRIDSRVLHRRGQTVDATGGSEGGVGIGRETTSAVERDSHNP